MKRLGFEGLRLKDILVTVAARIDVRTCQPPNERGASYHRNTDVASQ